MIIEEAYLGNNNVVLRDVDGNIVTLPLRDSIMLLEWLRNHEGEIRDRLRKEEEEFKARGEE